MVCTAVGFVTAAFLRLALAKRNASRDAADMHDIDGTFGDDLTDKQNPNFRYVQLVSTLISEAMVFLC